MAGACKKLAIIILVGAVVLGILIFSFSGQLVAVIPLAISGVFSFIPLYAIGEILDKLDELRFTTREQERLIRKLLTAQGIITETRVDITPTYKSVNMNQNHKITPTGEWICNSCQTANLQASMTCKDCGKYK